MNDIHKIWIISNLSIFVTGLMVIPITSINAAPVDPDNAALLYYQAFLLCPELDSFPHETIRTVYHQAISKEEIDEYRKYVDDYRNVIQLVQAASTIQYCNWTIPKLIEWKIEAKIISLSGSISFLIALDSRILAYDGDYKAALSQCIILLRFAMHIAEDPHQLYSVPVDVEKSALLSVNRILDNMPPDKIILKWLLGQLVVEPLSESLSSKIKRDFERKIATISNDEASLSYLREKLIKKATSEEQRNKILNFKEEELVGLISEPYIEFLGRVLNTLDSEMPFEQKYDKLKKLSEEYKKQDENNPAIITTLKIDADTMPRLYGIQVAHAARFNAIKAAVEIYLLKAQTGRLPDKLPDDLPKDPLTCEDFEYKIMEEGFMLSSSCKSKELLKYDVPKYNFKVIGQTVN